MPNRFRQVLLSLLLIPLLLAPASVGARAASTGATAETTIAGLNAALESAMNAPASADFATRRALLEPLMLDVFDYTYMATVAAGRFWAKMTSDEKNRYLAAFETLSINQAASRFKSKPGTRFLLNGGRDGPRGSRLIETRLQVPGGESRRISYLLQSDGENRWRIVDVFFDGTISELATRRSEYTSVLGSQGVNALIAKLEEKARAYAVEK